MGREGPRSGVAGRRHALPDGGGGGLEPALGPLEDRSEHGLERVAARGEAIAHAHRRTRVDQSLDNAFGLELSQPLSEDAIADPRYPREQLIESRGCGQEGLYDCARPALSDQLNRTLKRRAVLKAPTDHGERFYSLTRPGNGDLFPFSKFSCGGLRRRRGTAVNVINPAFVEKLRDAVDSSEEGRVAAAIFQRRLAPVPVPAIPIDR